MRRHFVLLGSALLAMFFVYGVGLFEMQKPANAAFPGKNGRIAFHVNGAPGSIYTMNPDGSDRNFLKTGDAGVAWSPDGTKIAYLMHRDRNAEIAVMQSNGTKATRLTYTADTEWSLDWSPDGKKLLFSRLTRSDPTNPHSGGSYDLYVMNADGTSVSRLTDDPGDELAAVWSPDGTKIAYMSHRDGDDEIYVMNADGTGTPNQLTNNSNPIGERVADRFPDWSPDGTKIAFDSARDGVFQVYVMNADGTDQTNISNTTTHDSRPVFSPDGTKIAFISNRDHLNAGHVYVMNTDGTNQTRVSTSDTADEYEPSWQPAPTPPLCFGSPATVVDTAPTSEIKGTSGADVIVGSAGPDFIQGFGGNDKICGAGGGDSVFGGAGEDSVGGDGGTDTVDGGLSSVDPSTEVDGNDVVNGGSGIDNLTGAAGADKLYGGGGDDTLDSRDGVNGNDALNGGTNTDTCIKDTTEKSLLSCER